MKKRMIASAIDWGIITIIAALLSVWLPDYRTEGLKRNIILLFLALAILFKDLLFRNASLGKWLMGLRIHQSTGERKKASVSSIIKRNAVLVIPVIFYVELFKLVKGKCRLADDWFHTKVESIRAT